MSTPNDPRTIGATDTVFDIIDHLKGSGSAGVTEVAEGLGLAKSTVHGHLTTLERRGYVVNDEGRYRLGMRFLDLGMNVRRSVKVFDIVKPKMERLAAETEERTQFMVEEHGCGFYLHRAEGGLAVPTDSQIGKPRLLHTCSTGKALLASLPGERVDEIIEQRGLPRKTSNTITERTTLEDQLERVRERGYAVNRAESVEGLWAIGAPVRLPNGTPVGALSVSGPAHRMMSGDRFRSEIRHDLLGTIEEIELNISYS